MRKFWLHIILLVVAATGFSQTYDFKNYNVEDGLAQSQVNCIFQDSKGYMWFGTNDGGASKFDGKVFKNFSTGNGFISNTVFSIAEDKNQNLYFSTNDGLQIKNAFKDVKIDTIGGLPTNTVYNVLIDSDQKIWMGSQKGVYYLTAGNKAVKLNGDKLLEESAVFRIYQDNEGNFWFGTIQNGACFYNPRTKTYTWFGKDKGLIENFVRAFNEDSKGNIFIGTIAGLYMVDESKKMSPVTIPNIDLPSLAILSIIKDKNNSMWLSTSNGVIKYGAHTYERFLTNNGLVNNLIIASFIDNEGNLWFASNGFGISKLSSEAIVNYTEKDGLAGDYINAIYQTRDSKYWIALRNMGLQCIHGKEKT